MENIHIRFMKNLRNIEFGELFDIISEDLVARNVEIPLVKAAIEKLKPHRKELLRMNNKKLKHPLTQLIQKQVNNRTEYLACLRLTVDAKMLSHKSEERAAAAILVLWLSPYKEEIYVPTIHTQSRMVEDLMNDRKESSEIQQATALLNLDELLEVIAQTSDEIRINHLLRLNEKDIYNVNGFELRNAAYKDLKVLLNVLVTCYNLCPDDVEREQLVELSARINDNLKDFRTLLRSRITKRKNKKDVMVAIKELINDLPEGKGQEKVVNDLQIDDRVEFSGGKELSLLAYKIREAGASRPQNMCEVNSWG